MRGDVPRWQDERREEWVGGWVGTYGLGGFGVLEQGTPVFVDLKGVVSSHYEDREPPTGKSDVHATNVSEETNAFFLV